jgi:hypothetical protein
MSKIPKIRRSISIDVETEDRLTELGDGNLSKGIRKALGEQDVPSKKITTGSSEATMVYMKKDHKKFLKSIGLNNLSKGLRLVVDDYQERIQTDAAAKESARRNSPSQPNPVVIQPIPVVIQPNPEVYTDWREAERLRALALGLPPIPR